MAETSDAQPAGSSPAAETSPAAPIALDALNETDLHTWRMTGALPDATSSTTDADSSPAAADPDPAASATPAPPDQPASPPAWDPAALKAETRKRFDELLAERTRERERADRAEQALKAHRPAGDDQPAASSAAPTGPVKPDPEMFPYGTSDPAYLEALTDFKVAQTLAAERAAWDQTQQQAIRREAQQRVVDAFKARHEQARAKHPDFDAVAMLAPTEIPQGSAADLWVLEDEAGAEILYHLQKPEHTAERRRILALGPRDQVKELVRLGDRLTATPPAGRSTTAPPPPPVLGTRPAPDDPVERALALGDDGTAAYIAAMNRRDLARLKR